MLSEEREFCDVTAQNFWEPKCSCEGSLSSQEPQALSGDQINKTTLASARDSVLAAAVTNAPAQLPCTAWRSAPLGGGWPWPSAVKQHVPQTPTCVQVRCGGAARVAEDGQNGDFSVGWRRTRGQRLGRVTDSGRSLRAGSRHRPRRPRAAPSNGPKGLGDAAPDFSAAVLLPQSRPRARPKCDLGPARRPSTRRSLGPPSPRSHLCAPQRTHHARPPETVHATTENPVFKEA